MTRLQWWIGPGSKRSRLKLSFSCASCASSPQHADQNPGTTSTTVITQLSYTVLINFKVKMIGFTAASKFSLRSTKTCNCSPRETRLSIKIIFYGYCRYTVVSCTDVFRHDRFDIFELGFYIFKPRFRKARFEISHLKLCAIFLFYRNQSIIDRYHVLR